MMSSPLFRINKELAEIESKTFNISSRLDFNKCFVRIRDEEAKKRVQMAKIMPKSTSTVASRTGPAANRR